MFFSSSFIDFSAPSIIVPALQSMQPAFINRAYCTINKETKYSCHYIQGKRTIEAHCFKGCIKQIRSHYPYKK